jgi:hypothetical protein
MGDSAETLKVFADKPLGLESCRTGMLGGFGRREKSVTGGAAVTLLLDACRTGMLGGSPATSKVEESPLLTFIL